ncbi:MAG: alpha/beta hydrolase [Burkholderiaceae bacterium]
MLPKLSRRVLAVGCCAVLTACAAVPDPPPPAPRPALITGATATPRTWQLAPEVKALAANGYEMAYLERGSGTPVVLVHGSLSDYRSWSNQIDVLAARHKVIAISLRHHYPERWDGRSDDFTLAQHADDLAEFIRRLDLGKVHVVGHSRGAAVVLSMATRHPDLLRSMVLAEPQAIDGLIPVAPDAAQAAQQRRAAIGAALSHYANARVDSGLEHFIEFVGGAGAWKAAAEPQRQVWRDNARSIQSLIADSAEPITCGELSQTRVPALLVAAEKSPPIYRVMLDAVRRCLPVNESVTISNAGHSMHRLNPPAFNAAVLGFMAKH